MAAAPAGGEKPFVTGERERTGRPSSEEWTERNSAGRRGFRGNSGKGKKRNRGTAAGALVQRGVPEKMQTEKVPQTLLNRDCEEAISGVSGRPEAGMEKIMVYAIYF